MIPPATMGPAIFVVGTDTGVGKTVVAAALARAAGAGVMKPLSCGLEPGETVSADTRFLISASGSKDSPVEVSPATFQAFRAPLPAARLEAREIDLEVLRAGMELLRKRHRALVIEGVGGVRVPVAPGVELRDLIQAWGLQVLIVARSGLGTLNHTALTAEALASRGIPILGFLLNDGASPCEDAFAAENAALIREMTGLTDLGRLKPDPEVIRGRLSPASVSALAPAARRWLARQAEA